MNLFAIALLIGLVVGAFAFFIAGWRLTLSRPLFSARLVAAGFLIVGLSGVFVTALSVERAMGEQQNRESIASALTAFPPVSESDQRLAQTLRALPPKSGVSPILLGVALINVLIGLIGLIRPRWTMLPRQRQIIDEQQISSGMEPTA